MVKKAGKAGSGRTAGKTVEALRHADEKRRNIPTAEYQSVVQEDAKSPVLIAYERRNRDLDPQLVWRGKDQMDWSDLVVPAPPLYIQEKVHPKVLVDDLLRQVRERREAASDQPDLFADFNGIPEGADKTDFYHHDQNWSNRMILGDSLQVMASLAEREGLRGKVQCIYIDPPYGIKFNSNFQWSTTSRDVKDGYAAHVTREPEQVKAFRDTWRDGIHSYLTYLRDRLTVARDLLTESGSVFVQIGDENVHRVRALMDEVFGESNFVNTIVFKKKSATYATETVFDYLIWFCRSRDSVKVRDLYESRAAPDEETKFNTIVTLDLDFRNVSNLEATDTEALIRDGGRWARVNYPIVSQHPSETRSKDYVFRGKSKTCGTNKQWRFDPEKGMRRLDRAGRLFDGGGASLGGVVFWDDWNQIARSNIWDDIHGEKFPTYVVQTAVTAIQRCILMTTDPGDLVLDPTCGSGTTSVVAEQWGRRWIAIDTSRVALALARARIMGARYPYYLLADSAEGQLKEADVSGRVPSSRTTNGSIRQGFVYERVPRLSLKSIADNAELDVIWEKWQETLEPLRQKLNAALGKSWPEWDVPCEAEARWPEAARRIHADWWTARIARQKEIDASIAAKAEVEYLYEKPYPDNKKVRVAGPFTVESLSPHRVLDVNEDGDPISHVADKQADYADRKSFPEMILENLRIAGVQQAHKDARIVFTSLAPWPGDLVCADGRYREGEGARGVEKRAAIFIGPEFGTVTRPDLVQAAK
ncbi:MAG: site-specific DNA-methyltransferase, partial [Thermoanaerobaculia bacterium]|nr:site-specific DNA-methyltransferase [Thermoanaerobaculia bacterium]